MPIQALVFDVGGVLIDRPGRAARAAWEAARGKATGFLDEAFADAVGPGWEGGRTEDEILGRLRASCGVTIEETPALLEVLGADERFCPEMRRFIERAHGRYRLALLTNAGPGARAELTGRWGLDAWFEVIVVSAEEGLSKPHPAIYARTSERLGVRPEACLFLDDRETNVLGARAAGMSSIRFRSAAETLPEVEVLLRGPA